MTPEKMIEQAELMIRYAKSVQEGKPIRIECRSLEPGRKWEWTHSPAWNFHSFEYREAVKPIERVLLLNQDGEFAGLYEPEILDDIEKFAKKEGFRVVHMREVEE